MKDAKIKIPLRLGAKIALKNTLQTVLLPGYIFVIAGVAFLIGTTIVWSLNFNVLWFVFTQTNIGVTGKLQFFLYGFSGLFSTGPTLLTTMVVLTALLGGITTALLLRVYRQRRQMADAGKVGAAMTLAAVSGGCAACGTSLFAPLLSIFGATSVAAVHSLGAIMLILSSGLLIVSAYQLALMVAVRTTRNTHR